MAAAELAHARTPEEMHAFMREGIRVDPGCRDVQVVNFKFRKTFEAPNAYVLCVSKRYDPDRLLMDFAPADACVEISNPPGFVQALDDVMKEHGRFVGAHACEYTGRVRKFTDPHTPAFVVKDPDFAHQYEIRLGWEPYQPLKETFIDVVNPSLRNHCRRVL
jgi:hypothetical protein